MVAHQVLVEVLGGEALVHLGVERPRPRQLAFVGAPRRWLADAPVAQSRRARLPVPPLPAPERPLRHPQHLPGLRLRQMPPLMPVQQLLEAHDPDFLQSPCPPHPLPPDRSGAS